MLDCTSPMRLSMMSNRPSPSTVLCCVHTATLHTICFWRLMKNFAKKNETFGDASFFSFPSRAHDVEVWFTGKKRRLLLPTKMMATFCYLMFARKIRIYLFRIIDKRKKLSLQQCLSRRFTRTTGRYFFLHHSATCRFSLGDFLSSFSLSLDVFFQYWFVTQWQTWSCTIGLILYPLDFLILDVKMSSNHGDEEQKLNKKQRRKLNRGSQPSTRPPDEDLADPTPMSQIGPTETTHPSNGQAPSIVNGLQALVLNIPEQVWPCSMWAKFLFSHRAASFLGCIVDIA